MHSSNTEYWKKEALRYKELYEAYYHAKRDRDEEVRAAVLRCHQLLDRLTSGFKKCDEYKARGERAVPVDEMRNALFGGQ